MAITSRPTPSPGANPRQAQIETLFAQGLDLHGRGEFAKAMHTYEQVLRLAPRHFPALHHVGIVAFQVGNYDMAAGFFRSALAVDPGAANAHNNLGNALREMQQLEEALPCYDRALKLDGGDADTHYNRGVTLQALGRHGDALHSYDQALAINAGDDQAWSNRAAVLQQMQEYDAALHSAEQACAVNPHNPEAFHHRGNILQQMGQLDQAAQSYRQALELAPDYAEAHYNLGRLLQSRGLPDEALQCYGHAIRLAPGLALAYQQRAMVLDQLGRRDEAQRDRAAALELQQALAAEYRKQGQALQQLDRPESAARMYANLLGLDDSDGDDWQSHARALSAAGQHEAALASMARALALKPDSPAYQVSQGIIQRAARRYAAAQQSFERAIQLAPHHPAAHINLGSVLAHVGNGDLALEHYARALALDPDNALAHTSRALLYLQRGDYQRGWHGYEWRWKITAPAAAKDQRAFAQPAWSGREPLAGKTVLLHAEQGLGDTLQFCRYATLVAQRGATVILEAQAPLAGLLGTLEGVARVISQGEPLPPFDYHIPLMSLPLAFDTRLDSIPGAAPYLASAPAKVAQWRALLGAPAKPRVGVVWSGNPFHKNNHNRSVPLPVFSRLFSDQYEFICLQKEIHPADLPLLDSLPVKTVDHLLHDMGDTAALCELVDVVITVDTSVAHLAGALGKPVWVLLQTPSEWRWLEHGAACPWYASATLYRQSEPDQWDGVIAAVSAELERLAAAPALHN